MTRSLWCWGSCGQKGFGEGKRPKPCACLKAFTCESRGSVNSLLGTPRVMVPHPQKLCRTIDEALAFQADPTTHDTDDACGSGEEHDEERDDALGGEVSDDA